MIAMAEMLFKFNIWWEEDFQPHLFPRPRYSDFLRKNLNNKEVILISGLRRVGKTSLIKLFIAYLLKNVEAKHILYISLDSLPLENFLIAEIVREYRKIHALPLSANGLELDFLFR
ncbi:MAG: AAA family ATPase [bacterium]